METPPPLSSIVETAVNVSDLDRACHFYNNLFGYRVMNADARFCALDAGPGRVLLLFLRGRDGAGTTLPFGYIPAHGTTGIGHIGFSIQPNDLEEWQGRLSEQQIELESCFTWPGGGTSIYFRDPDNNLLELLTPGVWPNY